jgi:LysR family glycine cleavage system transcriptional activator
MKERHLNLPLNPLRAFAIASQHKTFTSAANYMGVTQVAISRQIAILESYLGVQLFERGSRAVKLTEVGRAFGQEIAGLFAELESATQRILTGEGENTIHLRVYPTFAHHWLMPRLPAFLAQFPEYSVRLDTHVELLDFRGTHLDLAIQLGHGNWRDARSRKLFDEEVDVVCSPEYAARHGNFETGFGDVVMLQAKYRRREWNLWAAETSVDIDLGNGMDFDTSILTYSAAMQGLGLAVGQLDLVREEIDSGKLVCPFNRPVKTGLAFHIVWPTTKSTATQCKRFTDWLLETCGEKTEFFRRPRAAQ